MISNYVEGRTPHDLFLYFLEKGSDASVVGGTLWTTDIVEISRHFEELVNRHGHISAPIAHVSFRPPDDEVIPLERFLEIARWILREVGVELDRDLVIFLDRAGTPHLHVVFCRINLAGQLWDNSRSVMRLIEQTRKAEKAFNLTPVRPTPLREIVSKPVRRMNGRTEDDSSVRHELYEHVLHLWTICQSWEEFDTEAKKRRIAVHRIAQGTDRIQGVVFEYRDYRFRGSKIARAFSYQRLGRQFEVNRTRVKEVPKRDGPGLEFT